MIDFDRQFKELFEAERIRLEHQVQGMKVAKDGSVTIEVFIPEVLKPYIDHELINILEKDKQ